MMSFKELFGKNRLFYRRGEKFFTYNDEQIEFLEIVDITSKTIAEHKNFVYLQRELVVVLEFAKGGLHLVVTTKDIEQYRHLSELVEDIKRHKNIAPTGVSIDTASQKRWSIPEKSIAIVFLLFALNGLSENFFYTSLLSQNSTIATISTLTSILLMVWIVTSPMVWLAHKINERKLQREDDAIAGRESSVKDFDFTNVMIAILLLGLVYFVIRGV